VALQLPTLTLTATVNFRGGDMDGKRILAIIADVSLWRGDVYRLATIVAAEQRETDATKVEELGYAEVAESIREGS